MKVADLSTLRLVAEVFTSLILLLMGVGFLILSQSAIGAQATFAVRLALLFLALAVGANVRLIWLLVRSKVIATDVCGKR